MWAASDEPPGPPDGGGSAPEPAAQAKETCEQNKHQLESLKEIMLKNKQSLKKKEEEVQEYARRLSKIKSRAKLSRRSKESAADSPKEPSQVSKPDSVQTDTPEEAIDDISQARTPKAKSTLLQKKLAENRKAFEQRSKEITETKRAVEEKVEAMKQLLDEKDLEKMAAPVTPVRPVVVTSDIMSPIQLDSVQEKDNRIAELSSRILELEATVLDLQENLREKDSVIESKTKAVMLMSADLSKKGKTTLDTLEDTKDEMRTMQEHFVLMESSLRNKNESLLEQLQERDSKISGLEDTVREYEQRMNEQKLAESASADFTRTTMDTLVETKDAMRSMQENFVLMETSLKSKNDHLLDQLRDYEFRLAEANERIFQLESGAGLTKDPSKDDLIFKLEKLEQSNRQLQDEKYELQKSLSEIQDRIARSVHGNGAIIEKDNRIAELENLIEELKQSNKLLEEESKAELENQLTELTVKNEEYSNRVTDLEKIVHELEAQRNQTVAKLSEDAEGVREDERVARLTKELEELNKSMIKIKAQHRSKMKNLQKQLENFKSVSDTNAELVRLGNQLALLEEEKGNLQLSLVDFDELKASAKDWQERVAELESKLSGQADEIQKHVEAIAALENQKLELMQELHTAKQEISALEAENAESENLRVTAEMKVVDLEEQLESISKSQPESNQTTDLQNRIELLTQENSQLYKKLEEKATPDSGLTESFEAIQAGDPTKKNQDLDLTKRIEELTKTNDELKEKLVKFEEKASIESFVAINDGDRLELLRKIEHLTQVNSDLTTKLNRQEEKGSSDTGSTESFERIPEQTDAAGKIELLTQENSELVIKLTKLEEQFERIEIARAAMGAGFKVENLLEANQNQSVELVRLRGQVANLAEENSNLQWRVETLLRENKELTDSKTKLEESLALGMAEDAKVRVSRDTESQVAVLLEEKDALQREMRDLRDLFQDLKSNRPGENEIEELKQRVKELSEDNSGLLERIEEVQARNSKLAEEVSRVTEEKTELEGRLDQIGDQDSGRERLELIERLERLNLEKESVALERQQLQEQITKFLQKPEEEVELKLDDVASLEREIEECKGLIREQSSLIEEMRFKLADKERELQEKATLIEETPSGENLQTLQDQLREMHGVIEEWRFKCTEMEERAKLLEDGKAAIEEGFRKLQQEYELLVEEKLHQKVENERLKEELRVGLENLEEEVERSSRKDQEIETLREMLRTKEEELHAKYTQLQNEMIVIDGLQDELQTCRLLIQEKETSLSLLSEEMENLKSISRRENEEEVQILTKEIEKLRQSLDNSRSLEDYNELLEEVRTKERILNELKVRVEEGRNENENLLVKVEELISRNQQADDQIMLKEKHLEEVESEREYLNRRVELLEKEKAQAERRVSEFQDLLDNNNQFVEGLRTELADAYRQMEQLKEKHLEDVRMQSQRLETILEELTSKTEEVDRLRTELEEKEALIGLNVTQEAKSALEARIAELEQKVSESEDRIQAQLEKMKKIAANLKKKTSLCQELEARLQELQERWNTEKDEKEAKNRRIQEVEAVVRERDCTIAELEDRLDLVTNQSMEATAKMEKLTRELLLSEEKVSSLTEQITEMEEEIINLRSRLESRNEDLNVLEEEKQRFKGMYESLRSEVEEDRERKETELEEVKERARELSVRMQVMESEYVEQLSVINNLRAEIGMLLSRQTQIQEKLENTEKESEERRLLLERLQNVSTTTISTQTEEEDLKPVEGCERCEQCQTLVQALEAKLQEREAEIENLDNELANSIGNFVQMRESLRYNDLMNQTAMRSRNLEEPYNELLTRFNALTSSNEEVRRKLGETIREKEELAQRIESLQGQNQSLEVATSSEEQPGETSKDLEDLTLQTQTLRITCQEQEEIISGLRTELGNVQSQLEELLQKERLLTTAKDNLDQEVSALKEERDSNSRRLADLDKELESYKRRLGEMKDGTRLERSVEPQEPEDAPALFDASKIFGTYAPVLEEDQTELARLRTLVDEKEAQLVNLTAELRQLQVAIVEERSQMSQSYDTCLARLKEAEERFERAKHQLDTLEATLAEKDRHIENLDKELNNVTARFESQCDKMKETESRLELLTAEKDGLIGSLKTELNSTRDNLEHLSTRHNKQIEELETYKIQIANLEAELRNLTDNELIQELEGRVSATLKERDLLQLQVNDLSRSLQELRDKVQAETQEDPEPVQAKEAVQEVVQDVGSSWDVGSSERLNVDEEDGWGWNPEEAQLAIEEHTPALAPSVDVLKARVDDLQEQIKELKAERDQLIEEGKVVQVRSGKMVKKLKEYKVQVESLQQQLKIQKSAGDFYQLDSAIEEELRSQIGQLEKSLADVREEQRKATAEKEALLKRLDVVVAANERYMEMKEWQDTDMEALRIQNKQLAGKVQNLEHQLQENSTSGPRVERQVNVTATESGAPGVQEVQEAKEDQMAALTKRYKEEMDDLKDEMEALATENEQLQQFLEEQRAKLSTLEAKNATDETSFNQRVQDLNRQTSELQSMLNKSREEYDHLRRQYEQTLMDANDQVSIMRQSVDLRNAETEEKVSKLELELSKLRDQLEASDSRARDLEKSLQEALQVRQDLEEKVSRLTMAEEKLLSTANSSLSEVTDLLNARIQEVADLKQELLRQYTDREKLEADLNSTIEGLTLELNEKKLELEDLRRSFTDKERELIEQRSVETVSAIVSQATQELVQRHAIDLEERDTLIRGLQQRISSLEEELSRYSEQAETWRAQLDSKEQEVRLLMETLSQKESQLTELRSSLEVSEQQLMGKESELARTMERLGLLESENQRHLNELEQLGERLNQSEANLDLRAEVEALKVSLAEKESNLAVQLATIGETEAQLETSRSEVQLLKEQLQKESDQRTFMSSELDRLRSELQESRRTLADRTTQLEEERLKDKDNNLQESNILDDLPLFRMPGPEEETIDSLKAELNAKHQEIEHLKYLLSENTYPGMIAEMQERIDGLYNEKTELEASLRFANQALEDKQDELNRLRMESSTQDLTLTDNAARERRSLSEQEEILRLQNELHAKEQEINELKYVIAEKESQLSLQEQPSDEFQLQVVVERLSGELYTKEQEAQHLKSTITELQKDLQQIQDQSEEYRRALEGLRSEKEGIRLQAETFLEEKLKEKEEEIDRIKQRLSSENQKTLEQLNLREVDLENLKLHLERSTMNEKRLSERVREVEEELQVLASDLAEKERRLAELSITKDTELHNLRVQIREKDARIEELLTLTEEEDKQLQELRNSLESRETEINALKKLLEDKVTEYELIRHAMKKDVPVVDTRTPGEGSSSDIKESTSQELDLALYMLHQRDVRCEELTHELMQLLEERDTLQLRLSNAIRVNEELRRLAANPDSPRKETPGETEEEEPLVEHPSPGSSRSEGPVEIAREAIDAPIGEDKEALAMKLSELQTVSHTKDVRLRDESELRHTQQMSLLAHKDVLSQLPPEAAARIVNANYTLSRDVQSQSSVLLNWLWGRSTPKVVHM